MFRSESLENALYLLVGVTILFVLLTLIAYLVPFFVEFKKELDYLNMEIKRTTGEGKKVWLRRRRKLWLSLIPFVRFK